MLTAEKKHWHIFDFSRDVKNGQGGNYVLMILKKICFAKATTIKKKE
jgi:hypothetical protein